MVAAHRHFVGWDQPAIEAASSWLVGRFGADMSDVVLALPGARAGRSLLAALVGAQPRDWRPPRIVTTAGLTDEFARLDGEPASRLVRTRAWEQALRGLPRRDIEALLAHRPSDGDDEGWRALAAEVRGLFGVLAAERLDFGAVAERMAAQQGREQRRWEALAHAQSAAEALLRDIGQFDPHRGRLAAVERGDLVRPDRQVVLVGVVEAIGLVRRLLDELPNVTALVFAPEDERDAFDPAGCLLPDVWLGRCWSVPMDSWKIAGDPDDQARLAMEAVASWDGRYSAERITIGVGDPAVTPFIERRLGAQGVFARDAGGTSHEATPPARLLAGVASYLRHGRFSDLAALARHPDVEDLVAADVELEDRSCADVFDGYHERHLPGRAPSPWLRSPGDRDGASDQMAAAVGAALDHWLEPLRGGPRPTSAWASAARDVLTVAYGDRVMDPESQRDRLTCEGLSSIADALTCLEELPEPVDFEATAAQALELVLEESAARRVPPRSPGPAEPTIELLGWLELAFDPSPALVVTGFNEGFIPEAVTADGWMPETLRAELGVGHDASRLARDLYTLEWITRSRERVTLITGRRGLDGDPMRPSRLAFRGSPPEVLERVRHFLADSVVAAPSPTSPSQRRSLLLPTELTEPESWSATSFASYLRSPYEFALRRLGGLETVDDRAQEMSPLLFGDVGHDILRSFGGSDLAATDDVAAIEDFLMGALDARCAQRFGDAPLPAVALQRRQLAWRLRLFAREQAARVADGWRIAAVEWRPAGQVTLDVDGQAVALTGQVDRIDRREDGAWAILDYKFSDGARAPERAHLSRGRWVDVQLPLYAYLARELIGDATPQLGYWVLGATESDSGILMAAKWDPATLEQALEAAREVVREVRALLASGSPTFDLGRPYLRDAGVFADVCGVGLFGDDDAEDGA